MTQTHHRNSRAKRLKDRVTRKVSKSPIDRTQRRLLLSGAAAIFGLAPAAANAAAAASSPAQVERTPRAADDEPTEHQKTYYRLARL